MTPIESANLQKHLPMTLELEATDWLGLIFGAVTILIVIGLVMAFRSRPKSNSTHVTVGVAQNSPIVVDNSDSSVRQTRIDAKVNVKVLPRRREPLERESSPSRTARPSNSDTNGPQGFMVAVGLAILIGVGFYLQYFEWVVLATRSVYLALVVYSNIGFFTFLSGWIEARGDDYFWFLVYGLGSAAGAFFLFDAQNLIDQQMIDGAQAMSAPVSAVGGIRIPTPKLTLHQWIVAGLSLAMCGMSMFNAWLTASAVARTFVISTWEKEERGWLGRTLALMGRSNPGLSYLAKCAFLMCATAAMRYWWLPLALTRLR